MNRALSVFLITAAFSSLALVANFNSGLAQQSTQVSGVLRHDTVWGKQGSPYVFVGAVGVPVGVTLTVEAGVVVDVGSYYLEVNGTLNVQGTDSENVFLLADEDPSHGPVISWVDAFPFGHGYNNIVVAYGNPTVNIKNAVLNNTSLFGLGTASEATVTIKDSALVNSAVDIRGSTTISGSYFTDSVLSQCNSNLSGNTFLGGVEVSGDFVVSGNNITRAGGAAVMAWGSGVISGNIIWGSNYGITQDDKTTLSATVERNLIINNTCGIYLRDRYDDAVIKDNTFTVNGVGIFNPSNKVAIVGNSFIDNVVYDIQAGSDAISAAGNFWGTTSSDEISRRIYDSNDDFSLGTIIYTPFLASANPNAPGSPADLMLPSATASPTDSVTFQTVNNPTLSLGGFEVGVVAVVVFVAVSVAVVAVRMRGKRA
jgi:parallel beta-helix repeat protein